MRIILYKSINLRLFIPFCIYKCSEHWATLFSLKLLKLKMQLQALPLAGLLPSIKTLVFIGKSIYIMVDHMRLLYKLHFQKALDILMILLLQHLRSNFIHTIYKKMNTKIESNVALSRSITLFDINKFHLFSFC